MAKADDNSIIVLDKFIQATRDSGYKGTESAIAELVDNALQAGAKRVSIRVTAERDVREYPLRISVLDDGCGMDRRTLRQALRFGGSTRFNDRSGLGRYGMGLPNSSLSQARRVEVYSWRKPGGVLFSCLDVDEIAGGRMTEVPDPKPARLPGWVGSSGRGSGTLVVWTRCDRLDHRRESTIARRLLAPLGRVFRYYLWRGVAIEVNGTQVEAIDPLYLHQDSARNGARPFGEPIEYNVEAHAANGKPADVGRVWVRFSELPVHDWHSLSNDEKRQMGIANGAGVSVVRAEREIDYGWFFMGGKRRENYDDWWRCEIRFDPVLDEAFGITHTKQQIRPQDYLLEILSPDIENQAKALNGRVRQTHFQVRATDRTVEVEQLVGRRDSLLKPLPKVTHSPEQRAMLSQIVSRNPSLKEDSSGSYGGGLNYKIVYENLKGTAFYSFIVKNGTFLLVLNPEHPFYRKVYKPLLENDTKENKAFRSHFDLLLLAVARAEAAATKESQRDSFAQLRKTWSDNLATFLNG